MNPVVDTIMLVGFVLFIAFILIGYSKNRMLEVREKEKEKDE